MLNKKDLYHIFFLLLSSKFDPYFGVWRYWLSSNMLSSADYSLHEQEPGYLAMILVARCIREYQEKQMCHL